jgi:type I restriction enzyme S subunit
MNEWKEVRLGELAEVQTGPFGSQLHAADYVIVGTPSIMPTNIGARLNVTRDKLMLVSDEDIKRLNKYTVKETDIVYSRRGDVEKCAYITKNENGWLCGTGCLRIRFTSPSLNPKFCGYYLSTNEIKSWLLNNAVGSTMPNLNSTILAQVPLMFPPLPEQQAIAEVLSSLDDKIDLLHRNNKTLEEMAETLFRQWFVEGNKEVSNLHKLGDFIKVESGYSYRSVDLNPSSTALVTLKNFNRNGGFRLDGFKEYSGRYKLEQVVTMGDLVVAHTDITQEADVLGNPAIVIDDGRYDKLVISTDLVKVISTSFLSKPYLYYLMRQADFKHYCLGASNGTTVMHLSKKALPEYEFYLPEEQMVKKFTSIVEPLFEKIGKNIKQINQLQNSRDTLLPKLMSGQIRVKI